MLKLYIQANKTAKPIPVSTGVVDLKTTQPGTVYCHSNGNSITLFTAGQKSGNDCIQELETKRILSMINGGVGSLKDSNTEVRVDDAAQLPEYDDSKVLYSYTKGLVSAPELTNYVKYIHGRAPLNPGGNMILATNKTLDIGMYTQHTVDDQGNDVETTSIAIHTPFGIATSLTRGIVMFTWRLYHFINRLAARLQVWAPYARREGNPLTTTFGPYLGTVRNYQSLIARWNAYAWGKSFLLDVVPAAERLAIAVGYTSLDCVASSVTYHLTVEVLPGGSNSAGNGGEKFIYAYTIYDQGVDSTLRKNANIDIETHFYRNGAEINGSGYIKNNPDGMSGAELETTIHGKPAFLANQHYYNIISIAPCSGIDREYTMPDPDARTQLEVTATWVVDGETFTKSVVTDIMTTGYSAEEGTTT